MRITRDGWSRYRPDARIAPTAASLGNVSPARVRLASQWLRTHLSGAQAEFAKLGRGPILLGALFVTAIFGIAGLLALSQRATDIAQSMRAAEDLSRVLAEQTTLSIQPVDAALRELTVQPADPTSTTIDDHLVERLHALPQADGLMLVDMNGHVTNASRMLPAANTDVSASDYFKYLSAHSDNALLVGAPANTDRGWSVFLARRINDAHGGFAGVAVAALTQSYLQNSYQAVTPRNGAITLLRRDGLILARSPALEQPVTNPLPPASPWYTAVTADGGSYRSPAELIAVQPLHDFPLVIDVSTAMSAALSAWPNQVLALLGSALFAAAGVIVLLWIIGRQTGRLAARNLQLETSRQNFETVLDTMSQGLTFFDAEEKLTLYNHRYTQIYKLPAGQVWPGISFADIVRNNRASGSFPDTTIADYLSRRRALTASAKSFDVTDKFRDGRTVLLHYHSRPDGGWVVTHDAQPNSEPPTAPEVRQDALTRLPNRALLLERLAEAIALTRRAGHCALLSLDLDHFKSINETLGRPVGDALLRAVAVRLSSIVREGDTVARLAGDRFAIVLPGLNSPRHAASLAERLVLAFEQPYEIEEHRIIARTSIGVSLAPKDGTSLDTLLKNADIALYLAKADGQGTYRFFEPEIDSYVQRQRAVKHDLRAAQPKQDFVLYYQPILDLKTGNVAAFEALIRWQHPTLGLLDPADFIPVAEETGLIVPIGAWVLRQACQDAAGWPDHIGIAVNLSPIQFRHGQIVAVVQDALTASGLEPHRLKLEITEAALLENADERLAVLQKLTAIGVCIVLEDFGAGSSSLSHLRSFPFTTIKLDRTLLQGIETNPASVAVLRAIVGLAQSLGMTTTAEAVEQPQQLAALTDVGCTAAQGYLFSQPRPAIEAPGLIRGLRLPLTTSATDLLPQSINQPIYPPDAPEQMNEVEPVLLSVE